MFQNLLEAVPACVLVKAAMPTFLLMVQCFHLTSVIWIVTIPTATKEPSPLPACPAVSPVLSTLISFSAVLLCPSPEPWIKQIVLWALQRNIVVRCIPGHIVYIHSWMLTSLSFLVLSFIVCHWNPDIFSAFNMNITFPQASEGHPCSVSGIVPRLLPRC